MIAICIVAIITELLVALAFVFNLSFVTVFCELLIHTKERKFVVSIMIWIVIIPPRKLMVQDSAAQTSDGKLMSADP